MARAVLPFCYDNGVASGARHALFVLELPHFERNPLVASKGGRAKRRDSGISHL